MNRRRILIFLTIILVGCWQKNPSEIIIEHLENNPADFEKVVSQCFSDPSLLNNIGKFIEYGDLKPETKSGIKKINFGTIYFVTLALEQCGSERSIKLEIQNINNEHLEFSQCKSIKHKFGQKETLQDGFIDVYYLNDNWTLWVDNDPL